MPKYMSCVDILNKYNITLSSASPSSSYTSLNRSLLLKMPGAVPGPRTLYDKVFQDHIVDERDDGTILLYIGMLRHG